MSGLLGLSHLRNFRQGTKKFSLYGEHRSIALPRCHHQSRRKSAAKLHHRLRLAISARASADTDADMSRDSDGDLVPSLVARQTTLNRAGSAHRRHARRQIATAADVCSQIVVPNPFWGGLCVREELQARTDGLKHCACLAYAGTSLEKVTTVKEIRAMFAHSERVFVSRSLCCGWHLWGNTFVTGAWRHAGFGVMTLFPLF